MRPDNALTSQVERIGTRIPGYLLFATLAAPLTIVVLAFALPIAHLATTLFNDDGFFYLVVARNQATGLWSTFDGSELTNGYHPLWLFVITPLFHLPIDKELACRLVVVLSAVLLAAAGTLLAFSIRAQYGTRRAALAVSLLYLFVAINGWYGLESPLAVFLILCVVLAAQSALGDTEHPRSVRLLATGMLGAAAMLARLDSALLMGPLLLSIARSTRSLRRAALVLGPAAVAIGGYLVVSRLLFGHAMPISGALKSSFPHLRWPAMEWTDMRWARVAVTALVLGIPLVVIRVGLRRGAEALGSGRVTPAVARAWAWGLAGGLAHLFYDVFFQRDADWSMMPWHFAASLTLGVAVWALVMPLRWRWSRSVTWCAVLIVPVLAVVRLGPLRVADRRMVGLMNCATWLARHPSPPGTSVAVTDPGIVAYFSGHATVALDGLINNYRYQRVLANGELSQYLSEKRVDYIVIVDRGVATAGDDYVLELPSLVYGGSSRLELSLASRLSDVPQTRNVGMYRWVRGRL
jgi:hypothetical protein